MVSDLNLQCPKCSVTLLPRRDVGLFGCKQCGGVWINGKDAEGTDKSLQELITRLRKILGTSGSPTALSCPECRTGSIRSKKVSGVEIEWCVSCGGVFFDRGELQRVRTSSTLREPSGWDGAWAGGSAVLGIHLSELIDAILSGAGN